MMQRRSEFIVEAMKYIDEMILQIDSRSIDRQRLHDNIHTQIVADVKILFELDAVSAHKRLNYIFKKQLNEEIMRRRKNEAIT